MALRRVEEPLKPRALCESCDAVSICWLRGAYVCHTHYLAVFQAEADAYCAERGLDTTEKKILHFRQQYRRLFVKPRDMRAWMKNPKTRIAREYADEVRRMQAIPERVPGEDDEQIAA